MCGFVGFWDMKATSPQDALTTQVTAMTETIAHRGPDSSGTWCDEKSGIALGHRRLSIMDLSENGHQPKFSSSGRFVVVYNGEIYNAPELRQLLEKQGVQFKGYSDTEVLLEAWQAWGPEKACQNYVGMFAFALWDRQEKTLFLVRDRVGVKPLYWAFHDNIVFFGSTLKNFFPHPRYHPSLNLDAVNNFVHFGYVSGSHCIFHNTFKVSPGTILAITKPYHCKSVTFWSFPSFPAYKVHTEIHLQEELETLLQDSVRCRLLSDVPVGAFLSGGIDSSLVVSLMQQITGGAVKTFSIGFHEKGYNEASYAAHVAKHLGTQHTELYLDSNEIKGLIPLIPTWYDEPFADSSQIPTYLVSKLAREQVKVALSGDGGDEFFAGYNRYHFAERFWPKINKIPYAWRAHLGRWGQKIPAYVWDILRLPAHKMKKLFSFIQAPHALAFYQGLFCMGDLQDEIVHDKTFAWPYAMDLLQNNDLLRMMQSVDSVSYLPDDILVKVDRASMAVGLEVRSPLLDHRLIEFAMTLPPSMKIRGAQTKYLLRKILYKYVPASLIERPKMGFGIPLSQWLRGPLKEWGDAFLSQNALRMHSFFNDRLIHKRWQEHVTHKKDWAYMLWNMMMFQAWHDHYKNDLVSYKKTA